MLFEVFASVDDLDKLKLIFGFSNDNRKVSCDIYPWARDFCVAGFCARIFDTLNSVGRVFCFRYMLQYVCGWRSASTFRARDISGTIIWSLFS